MKLPPGHLIKVASADSFDGWSDFINYPCEIELDEQKIIESRLRNYSLGQILKWGWNYWKSNKNKL